MAAQAVQVRHVDSIALAVMRRVARPSELARVVPECCGLVWNALRAQQAKGGRHVAVYWDGAIRLDVGVEALGPFREEGDLVRSATPAGAVASVTHYGPYSGLGTAHETIRRWVESHHRTLAGPSWEIYGHWLPEWNVNPAEIRTDVCYLLAEA